MTGRQLIDAIHEHNLENCTVSDKHQYIEFNIDEERHGEDCGPYEIKYLVLWLQDDYYQDVIFNHEGELTYGTD